MVEKNCIFCQIIRKEQKAEIIYENKRVIAFKDIHPKAEYHFLIVPKEHIESISSEGSEEVVGDLVKTAKKIARDNGISGYKLVFNVNREGGQIIDHLHLHFLAGPNIQIP